MTIDYVYNKKTRAKIDLTFTYIVFQTIMKIQWFMIQISGEKSGCKNKLCEYSTTV